MGLLLYNAILVLIFLYHLELYFRVDNVIVLFKLYNLNTLIFLRLCSNLLRLKSLQTLF